jgi:hypothetical protein
MVSYYQNYFNNDKFNDFDDEHEHHEKKTKRKSNKIDFDTKKGVYCQNCFNEGHFKKECKLLMEFCRICKASDHNIDQCPNKVVNGSFPSKDIILVQIVQI